jgi:hydroxymethylglutaryl-CoA lyase
VKIVEVGPRDGLQNERDTVSVPNKLDLIRRLTTAGLPVIEAGSFVSPKWVPQMADTTQVLAGLPGNDETLYPVLVPNLAGLQSALDAGARAIAVFASASESFSRRNLNCSIDQSLERYADVCAAARRHGCWIRGYVSCVLGCPYEGDVATAAVVRVAERLLAFGCNEVSLGDTIGVGTAGRARALIGQVRSAVPIDRLAVHFHDTYGQALANILAVLDLGITTVDSSVAGLGGCPYAQGATGNVATEDVVYMLDGFGVRTGVDLDRVVAAGRFISSVLERESVSRAGRALAQRAERIAAAG